jgi:hypothetical protein
LLRGVIRSDHLLLLMRLSTAVLLTTLQMCFDLYAPLRVDLGCCLAPTKPFA